MSNQKQLRVVFMGTPDFSVPTLEALIKAGHSIVGVYCQPDKQKGRGKQVQMPPVKVAALTHNLPVFHTVKFYRHGLFVYHNMDVLTYMHLFYLSIEVLHQFIMLY